MEFLASDPLHHALEALRIFHVTGLVLRPSGPLAERPAQDFRSDFYALLGHYHVARRLVALERRAPTARRRCEPSFPPSWQMHWVPTVGLPSILPDQIGSR